MSYHLSAQVRRIPLLASVLVVLLIALLLSLSLLFSTRPLGSSSILDPNGLVGGCTINPNGGCFHIIHLARGASIDPDGRAANVAWGHGPYPGHGSDPDGSKNQLASSPILDPNG